MEWFSKVDPNVIIGIVTALGAWLYHKLSGQQTASFEDTIRGIGKQIVDALVKAGDLTPEALTVRASALMEIALRKLGIPDNAITKALAAATVQHAVGDALAELRELSNAVEAADASMQHIRDVAASMDATMAKAKAAGQATFANGSSVIDFETVTPVPGASK